MPLGYSRGRGFGWLRPRANCCETMSFSRVPTGLLHRASVTPLAAVAGRQPTVASFGWPL